MIAILLLVAVLSADPPKTCRANLCGGDSYCSCHTNTTAGEKRCWTTEEDCKVDLACCAESKTCVRLERDACAEKTAAERKKRDGK